MLWLSAIQTIQYAQKENTPIHIFYHPKWAPKDSDVATFIKLVPVPSEIAWIPNYQIHTDKGILTKERVIINSILPKDLLEARKRDKEFISHFVDWEIWERTQKRQNERTEVSQYLQILEKGFTKP